MAFARLNGVEIGVRQGTASSERRALARSASTWSGLPRRDESAIVRAWDLVACLFTAEEADALEGLAEGLGYHFPFDSDAFSDNGLGPDTPAAGNYTIETDGAQIFGLGYLDILTFVIWDTNIRADYTAMYWRDVTGTPEHIVVLSDGRKFLNGVRADATVTTEFAVGADTGPVALFAGEYDDLVVLPYLMPDNFVIDIYGWMFTEDNSFSSLPQLVFDGDVVGGEVIDVLGRAEEQSYFQLTRVSTAETNARNVPIHLDEVQQVANKKFPEPWAAWLFDGGYENPVSSQVLAARGQYHATEQGTWTKGLAGPFGFGEAWDANANGYFDLGPSIARNLKGKTGITVLAWVKRNTLVLDQILITLELTAGGAERDKVRVKFNNSNEIAVECRPSTADATEADASGGSFADTTDFHLVGAFIDITGDNIGIIDDGAIVSQTGVSFTSTEFSDEAGDDLRIGADTALGQKLDADISALYVYDRVLSEEEFELIFELGKKGVLL